MSDPGNGDHQVRCPLCEGTGSVRKSKLVQKLTAEDLQVQITRYLAKMHLAPHEDEPIGRELVGSAVLGVDSQKEFKERVHHWTSTDDALWKRSPKE